MDYNDLSKEIRKDVKEKLSENGIKESDINTDNIDIKTKDNKLIIKYKDAEVSLPAPSQEAIDSWWKKSADMVVGAVVGAVCVVVGVAVGVAVASKDDS